MSAPERAGDSIDQTESCCPFLVARNVGSLDVGGGGLHYEDSVPFHSGSSAAALVFPTHLVLHNLGLFRVAAQVRRCVALSANAGPAARQLHSRRRGCRGIDAIPPLEAVSPVGLERFCQAALRSAGQSSLHFQDATHPR